MYNGVIQEVPNDMNKNWVYDSIDFSLANYSFAVKYPRMGEIWWFFPVVGDMYSCSGCVIYNYREKTWYDNRHARSSGAPGDGMLPHPVVTGYNVTNLNNEDVPDTTDELTYLAFNPNVLVNGGSVANWVGLYTHFTSLNGATVYGSVSGAVGVVPRDANYWPSTLSTSYLVPLKTISGTFVAGDYLRINSATDLTYAAFEDPGAQCLLVPRGLSSIVWETETKVPDRVTPTTSAAVDSYCETSDLSFVGGGPQPGAQLTYRLHRMEPDFIMTGNMTVQIRGRRYAHSPNEDSPPVSFNSTTEFLDFREQRRLMSLKFRSNEVGSTFQMGKILLTTEPGDERG